jgi:hypothetical protein
MKRRAYLFHTAYIALLLSGCAGYQLGGDRPAGIASVYMAPVINQTDEPAIELQVSHALRDRIQFDGRLKLLDSVHAADGTIEVTLTQYNIEPIAFEDEKQTTPSLYRLRITGNAVLKRTDTGAILSSSENYGEATLRYESNLTDAKRDAAPAAAAEMAKYMIDDLIEQW